MQDVLFEVALRSKIRTIMNIFCILPRLNTIYFWKLKCAKDYPEKYYLDCWSGPENYLTGNKKFCFNVYPDRDNFIHDVDPLLYEWTPILKIIQYPTRECQKNYEKFEIVLVEKLKQFILIIDGADNYATSQYETEEKVIAFLTGCHTQLPKADIQSLDAVVINLANISPCFTKYGVLKNRSGDIKYYHVKNQKLILN